MAVTPCRYVVVPCPQCGSRNARNLASTSQRRRTRLSGRAIGRWYACPDCERTYVTVEYAVVDEADVEHADRLARSA